MSTNRPNDQQKKSKKGRSFVYWAGSLAALALLTIADPDLGIMHNLPIGSGTVSFLINLSTIIVFLGVIHFIRKIGYPYVDLEEFFNKAKNTPEGAGYAIIGFAIIIHGLFYLIGTIMR